MNGDAVHDTPDDGAMSDPPAWYHEIVLPALLNEARATYGRAMRTALRDAGFDDVPRAGMRLIGGIANNGPAGPDGGRQLGIDSARADRLVETLRVRGYVRPEDGDDRAGGARWVLTDRGRAAARITAAAVATLDRRLAERIGAADVERLRATLATIVSLGDDD